MITSDGYLDWAMRLPRHPDKVYAQANTGEWITIHSIVGDLGTGKVPARFLSDERVPGDPSRFSDNAAASVMFILYVDGTLGQCYPISASTWTSGGREANTRSWAIEAEGGGPSNTREKLTRAAEDAFIRLVREWENWSGKKAVPGVHIRQHKDVAKEFGYPSTACASDRYSNAEARLVIGDGGATEVTRTEYEDLLLGLLSGSEEKNIEGKLLTRSERVAVATYRLGLIANGETQSIAQRAAQVAKHGHKAATTTVTVGDPVL